jgi:hypothetical protein
MNYCTLKVFVGTAALLCGLDWSINGDSWYRTQFSNFRRLNNSRFLWFCPGHRNSTFATLQYASIFLCIQFVILPLIFDTLVPCHMPCIARDRKLRKLLKIWSWSTDLIKTKNLIKQRIKFYSQSNHIMYICVQLSVYNLAYSGLTQQT